MAPHGWGFELPRYQQADCTLGQDDMNGIRPIYP
jgi:hypothetical protein